MDILQGFSTNKDSLSAIKECTEKMQGRAGEIKALIVYYSVDFDPAVIARYLGEAFPASMRFGCSTFSEFVSGKYLSHSIVVTALISPELEFDAFTIEDLKNYKPEQVKHAVSALFARNKLDPDSFDPKKFIALSLIDGMAGKEEQLIADVADCLEGIPVVGGSAGEDLSFNPDKPSLLLNDKALKAAAVFVLIKTNLPYRMVKHQHFKPTSIKMAITKADMALRTIYEIDGMKATEAYAKALGMQAEQVTSDIAFVNPLLFECDNESYLRAIRLLNPDGSMVLACGVEEGMIVSVASHQDMLDSLKQDLYANLGGAPVELFLGFNCAYRAIEATNSKISSELISVPDGCAKAYIGFDTYGEQYNGLHINQTLVGIGFMKRAA